MKIGLRTSDALLAEALAVLAEEHGDTLLPISEGEETDLLCDRILVDLDTAALRPGEQAYSVTLSYEKERSPMLLRPFTEDALWRALEASPGEGESSFGSPMVVFEGGNLYCCGKRLPLSQREAQIFSLLYYHQGSTLSPADIAREIWRDENRTNDVHVYIRYLRRKLDEPLGRTCILTVRGEGFRLRLPGGEGTGERHE